MLNSLKKVFNTAVSSVQSLLDGFFTRKPHAENPTVVKRRPLATAGENVRAFFSKPPFLPSGRRMLLVVLDGILIAATFASIVFFAYVKTAPDDMISVTLNINGTEIPMRIRPVTVSALLQSCSFTLGERDEVSPALEETLADTDTVFVTRAFPVAVLSEGGSTVLYMSGGSVGDALAEADVHYDVDDELSALAFADLYPGMQIEHTDVDTRYISSNKTLYYEEEVIRDSSLYTEVKRLETQGKNGLKQVTQRVTIKNGLEVAREIVDQLVLTPAINEVTRVGTKIHYMTNYTGETRLYREAPKAGVNGWVEMTVYRCTAYTGGSRTATGTRPQLGTISVNPKLIPYGSQIYVKGYGYGTAQDTGAFRNYESPRDNAIDLYFNTEKEGRRWGSKYNLTILVKKR